VVRSLGLANACAKLPVLGRRLIVDFNVKCDSPENKALAHRIDNSIFTVYVLVPTILAFALSMVAGNLWGVYTRRCLGLLFDGYKPHFFIWEVLTLARMFALSTAVAAANMGARASTMSLVMIISIIITSSLKPFENRIRNSLNRCEITGNCGVLAICLAGAFLRYEMATADMQPSEPLRPETVVLVKCAMWIPNVMFLWLCARTVLIRVSSVCIESALQGGNYVNDFALLLHAALKKMYGINPIGYKRLAGHKQHTVDISLLSRGERRILLAALTETISACIDSSNDFRLWLVNRAIHEGFRRAVQARGEKMRRKYDKWGTRPHALSTVCRCLRLTLRPLDMPPKSQALLGPNTFALMRNDRIKTIIATIFKLHDDDEDDHGDEIEADHSEATDIEKEEPYDGITVDELQAALQDVNVDVLQHHPALHLHHMEQQSTFIDGKDGKPMETKVWEDACAFSTFETDLDIVIKPVVSEPSEDLDLKVLPSDHVLNEIHVETEQFRGESKSSKDELRQAIESLEQEIAHLRTELSMDVEVGPLPAAEAAAATAAGHVPRPSAAEQESPSEVFMAANKLLVLIDRLQGDIGSQNDDGQPVAISKDKAVPDGNELLRPMKWHM